MIPSFDRSAAASLPPAAASRPAAPAKTPQQLMESCQGLVRSLAWKIHQKMPAAVELDDLIAYGQVGLAEAARDFDPSRGNQFTTYAFHRVRGAIFDGLGQMSWFKAFDYHSGRYERTAHDLLRADADDPAAAGAGDDPDRDVAAFADASGSLSVAYVLCDLGGANRDGPPAAIVDDSAPRPDAGAIRDEVAQRLLKAVDALPPDARALITHTYFEGTTLQDAGRRIGISKAWASRLHAKTLRSLARSLRQMDVDGQEALS